MKNRNRIILELLDNDIYDIESPARKDRKHSLDVSVNCGEVHNAIMLDFTTRLAMFEFGKSLMHEALFGYGNIEFNPYDFGNGPECVNGVRLTDMKTSIYISCGDDEELSDEDIGIVSEDEFRNKKKE